MGNMPKNEPGTLIFFEKNENNANLSTVIHMLPPDWGQLSLPILSNYNQGGQNYPFACNFIRLVNSVTWL